LLLKILHWNLLDQLKKNDIKEIKTIMKNTYEITDQQIIENNFGKSGSTAVTALFFTQTDINGIKKRMICIANIGNTSALIGFGNGKLKLLTIEHNVVNNAEEIQRIKNAEAFITQGKVAGVMKISRSFGNLDLKQWIICEPSVELYEIGANDTHLIIATDGLFDFVKYQEVVDLLRENVEKGITDPNQLAKLLLEKALQNGSTDNIAVVIVQLNPI